MVIDLFDRDSHKTGSSTILKGWQNIVKMFSFVKLKSFILFQEFECFVLNAMFLLRNYTTTRLDNPRNSIHLLCNNTHYMAFCGWTISMPSTAMGMIAPSQGILSWAECCYIQQHKCYHRPYFFAGWSMALSRSQILHIAMINNMNTVTTWLQQSTTSNHGNLLFCHNGISPSSKINNAQVNLVI